MHFLSLSLLYFSQWVLPGVGVWGEQCRLMKPQELAVSSVVPIPNNSTPSSSGTAPPAPSDVPLLPFDYGTTPVRGVNLGGWFVLEPWITPSIFQNTNNSAIVDEFTFGQMQDPQVALNVLQNHWETWITEDDFVNISAAGLNHVRIPLGYWSVPLTSSDTNQSTSFAPYIPGAWPYLLNALNWAKSNNLHVILDLHGVPGSQNGYDNSGQRTPTPVWALNPANVSLTLDIIRFIGDTIGGMVDVIELVNEAGAFFGQNWADVVRQYYSDGYTVVRDVAGGDVQVLIGDAFLGVDSWQDFLTYPSAQGVLMDSHQYQIFSDPELARTFDQHIAFACSLKPNFISFAAANIWTIIGEWSTPSTDCAMWLNGRGIGSRWDGSFAPGAQVFGSCEGWTGDMATFNTTYTTFLRQYWEAQVQVAESVQGWVYWTWKTESADEWSYQKGLEGGWIPQDPTDRMYPGICSGS